MALSIEQLKDLNPSIELQPSDENEVKGGFVVADDIAGF